MYFFQYCIYVHFIHWRHSPKKGRLITHNFASRLDSLESSLQKNGILLGARWRNSPKITTY